MPRWGFLASLPALQLATYSPDQIESAKGALRKQLHHIGADGGLVEEFVDKLLQEALSENEFNPHNHKLEDWTETTTELSDWNGRGDIIQSSYLSPTFKLKTGGAHFTLNSFYKVPVPKGDYAILNNTWEIVSDDGFTAVPLTQMYNHHWLIGGSDDPLAMCEGDYFFGGGAEYRNMDYTFLEGYGNLRINATGQCGANVHFISTEDLASRWEGFNNPDGNHGAAVKLACECGYEPGRADDICAEWADGSFLCCFTGSRARVNDPSNNATTTYRLRGTFEYSRDMSSVKHAQTSLMDVGGGIRVEDGMVMNAISEWNVNSYLNDEAVYTRCNDTVCSAVRNQVVGDGTTFGYGLCSGDMIWGYMHMHAGGIYGTMAVNGEHYCTSYPQVGTDPENPAGNEQGFLVGVSECVDERLQGNRVRLNKGDVLTITQHYDVDPESQRHFPLPGGKHGGIMALFFAFMDCDAGSFGDVYVKRNDTCVPVPHQKKDRVGEYFDTKALCEGGAEPSEEVEVVPESQELVADSVAEPESSLGKMNLYWRDCGGSKKLVNFTAVTPDTFKIGVKNKIQFSGQLSRDITAANHTVVFASGIAGQEWARIEGEACSESHDAWTLEHLIHVQWQPLGCPLAPGDFSGEIDMFFSPLFPTALGHTTTTLVAHHEGEELYCLELVTTLGDSPNGLTEIVV
jgi:hypothetical protein